MSKSLTRSGKTIERDKFSVISVDIHEMKDHYYGIDAYDTWSKVLYVSSDGLLHQVDCS